MLNMFPTDDSKNHINKCSHYLLKVKRKNKMLSNRRVSENTVTNHIHFIDNLKKN